MIQGRNRPSFLFEALAETLHRNLDGDIPAKARVMRPIHLASRTLDGEDRSETVYSAAAPIVSVSGEHFAADFVQHGNPCSACLKIKIFLEHLTQGPEHGFGKRQVVFRADAILKMLSPEIPQ